MYVVVNDVVVEVVLVYKNNNRIHNKTIDHKFLYFICIDDGDDGDYIDNNNN